MAQMDGFSQKAHPAAVVGVAVIASGFKIGDLLSGHIEEVVFEPVCIPLVAHRFGRDLAVICLGIQVFLRGDIVPGRVHFVPIAGKLDEVPGVRACVFSAFSGPACNDGASDPCFLQQILVGVRIAVANSAVRFAAAVGHKRAVSRMRQIFVPGEGGVYVVSHKIDELVVDLQRHMRAVHIQIDLREERVCGAFELLHLVIPLREGLGQLEGDVVSALVEQPVTIAVLKGTVAHSQPKELRVIE